MSETTEQVVCDRRLRVLRDLANRSADCESFAVARDAFFAILDGHADAPFASLYLMDSGQNTLRQEGSYGLAAAPGLFPLAVARGDADFWRLLDVAGSGRTCVSQSPKGQIAPLTGGTRPQPVRAVAALPVRRLGQRAGSTGVLAVGLNPRRCFDDGYRVFLELVASQFAAIVSAGRPRDEAGYLAELETVIDTVPAAVWFTYDPLAKHITGNNYAAHLLGFPFDASVPLSAVPQEPPRLFRVFRDGQEADIATLPLQRAARGETCGEEELVVRFDNGDEVTVLARAAPIRGAGGETAGAVAAAIDITERKNTETALLLRNRRLDLLAKIGNDLILAEESGHVLKTVFDAVAAEVGAEIYFLYVFDEERPDVLSLEASAGLGPDQESAVRELRLGDGLCGRVAHDRKPMVLDNVQDDTSEQCQKLRAIGGKSYMGFPVVSGQRLLGTISFASTSKAAFTAFDVALPMTVSDQVAAALDRDRLIGELKLTADRFQAAELASGGLVYEHDVERDATWRSAGFTRLLGYGEDEAPRGRAGWLALVHPADTRLFVDRPLETLLDAEDRYSVEYRVRHKDGHYVWVWDRGRAMRDAQGRVARLAGATADLTERKAAETQQNLLNRELAHRVKNSLAVIQAMARHTVKNSAPDDFAATFQARLRALGAAHDVLTNANWTGVDLAELARNQLSPYLGARPERLRLVGPTIQLKPEIATQMGLVLHEFATNAVKYGALSSDAGVVDVRWRVEGEGPGRTLVLSWTERGGPPVAEPTRKGFGMRLIESSALAVSRRFDAAGLSCDVTLAIPSVSDGA